MLLLLEQGARGRKELVIAAVWLKSFRSQSCLHVTHTVILFGGGKSILDPLLRALWVCTHMKQGGEAGGKAKKGVAPKLNCKHGFYAG